MSTLESDTLRRELLLEQAINKQLDELIRQATSTALALEGNRDMEISQLRNLLNVAVESRSAEVVVNFIRYQIARNGRAWGTGPEDFGHRVIKDLRGKVKDLSDRAVEQVRAADAAADVEELRKRAYVRLMQLYLGYLHRTFYFAKRVNSYAELKEVASA